MSLEDFTNSPICKNREHCSQCIHNQQFKSNICSSFNIANKRFTCPFGVEVPKEPVKRDIPILNEESDRRLMCESCPFYNNAKCSMNGASTPWLRGCPASRWTVNLNLPSIKEKVTNFFTFLSELKLENKIIAENDVAEYRLNICSSCPMVGKRSNERWVCGGCGCNLQNKVRSAQSECPNGYWGKTNQ